MTPAACWAWGSRAAAAVAAEPGNTIGIGAVGTRGVAGGEGKYGTGIGMGKKASADISITNSDPEVTGSMDPELIRRVVRSHHDQLKYCYDNALTKNPKLTGKVSVRWIIREDGTVASSNVVTTTTGTPDLDQLHRRARADLDLPQAQGRRRGRGDLPVRVQASRGMTPT